jgi:hypothetical protein
MPSLQLSTTGLFFQEAPMTRILIDVITNITFHSGVVRVECGTVAPDGKPHPSGSLLIPAPVARQVLQALIQGMQELEKKMREAQEQQQQMPPPPPGNA